MKKTLIIHIGSPKTGTSSIQAYLTENREKLKKHNFLYPLSGILESKGNAQHHLSFAIREKYPEWIKEKNYKNKNELYMSLKKEIDNSNCQTVFISSESFSSFDQESIQKLSYEIEKLNCTVQIICFVRRPDLWIESWYSQVVKGHPFSSNTFQKFIKSNKIDIFKKLKIWQNIFGYEYIKIINYEKAGKGGILELINTYLELPMMEKIENKNISPSNTCIEVLKFLNKNLDLSIPERKRINLAIVEIMNESKKAIFFNNKYQRLALLKELEVDIKEVSPKLYNEYFKNIQKI